MRSFPMDLSPGRHKGKSLSNGSPSEAKGISRRRDTGKVIDSRWLAQSSGVRDGQWSRSEHGLPSVTPSRIFPRDVNCLGRSSSTFRDGAIRPHGPRSLSTAEPAIFWMGDDPTGAWPRIPRLAFRVRRDVVPWWDFATGIGCRRQRCRLGRVRSSRGRLRITGLKPTSRS